jgi:hypothetical protein
MTEFTIHDLVVGRVVNEDDDFMLVEIAKDEHRKVNIDEGDQFYTMAFIHQPDDGQMEIWKPWQK